MAKEQLSAALSHRMELEKSNYSYTDRSFHDVNAVRRFHSDKPAPVWRPSFAKDIEDPDQITF